MSDYKRIHRQIEKDTFSHASIPAKNLLKTRGFGKGLKARSAELPTTNIWQTRPVPPPTQQPSQPPKTLDLDVQQKQAELFGYNGLDVPTFAPGAVPAPSDPSLMVMRNVVNDFNGAQIDDTSENSKVQREEMYPEAESELTSIPTPLLQGEGSNIEPLEAKEEELGGLAETINQQETPIAGTIQAKLTIGEQNEKYEQEADLVAPKVAQQNDKSVERSPQHLQRVGQQPTAQTASALPEDGVLQRMSIRNTPTVSTLSAATQSKHVEPAATQQARADSEYGSRTFVTQAADITAVVDANTHNFTEANGTKSARFDFNANVPISVYMKTPPNLGAGQPSVQTINNVVTNCEIGVVKTGTDQIQVTHFKMA